MQHFANFVGDVSVTVSDISKVITGSQLVVPF